MTCLIEAGDRSVGAERRSFRAGDPSVGEGPVFWELMTGLLEMKASFLELSAGLLELRTGLLELRTSLLSLHISNV